MKEVATATSYKDSAVAFTDKRSGFIEKRAMLAEKFQMKTEELPEYKVKTPLQKTIQILKRYRDIMFDDNFDSWLRVARRNLASYDESIEMYNDNFRMNVAEKLGIPGSKLKDLVLVDKVSYLINSISHRQKPKWNVNNWINVDIKATKIKKV